MPVTQIKESGTVIKKNDQNSRYAKPVKFIFSSGRIRNHLKFPLHVFLFPSHQTCEGNLLSRQAIFLHYLQSLTINNENYWFWISTHILRRGQISDCEWLTSSDRMDLQIISRPRRIEYQDAWYHAIRNQDCRLILYCQPFSPFFFGAIHKKVSH